MINKCIVCEKEFEAQKSTKKYCSKECMNAMRRIKYAEKQAEKALFPKVNNMPFKECLLCGKSFQPKTPAANLRQCCYDCMPDGVQLRRGDFIAKLKIKEGGKCIRCGYDKCISALEFHHKDPSKKDFGISDDNMRLKEAVEEVKKCILICSNCHREFHAGLWTLKELEGK